MNPLDARALLASGDADNNRDLLVWAIGAYSIGPHCMNVLQLLDGRYTTDIFGTYAGDIRIKGGRHGAALSRIYVQLDEPEVEIARITWPELAALFSRERVGEDLIVDMRDAMRIRRERTRVADPTRPSSWWQSDEAIRERDLWSDIERRCDDLGVQAWLRCRPVDVREPADLLELLAAIGGGT